MRILNFFIHLLAFFSIYAILEIKLDIFISIPSFIQNVKNVNDILVNFSYSYVTGYIIFLCTVYYPKYFTKKHLNEILKNRLDNIVKTEIQSSLNLVTGENKVLSDNEYIEQFKKTNLNKKTLHSFLQNGTIFNILVLHSESSKKKFDNILSIYAQYLSPKNINDIEQFKEHAYFNHIKACYYIKQAFVNFNNQIVDLDEKEKEGLAKNLLSLRDELNSYINQL